VATQSDRNVREKEAENNLKYRNSTKVGYKQFCYSGNHWGNSYSHCGAKRITEKKYRASIQKTLYKKQTIMRSHTQLRKFHCLKPEASVRGCAICSRWYLVGKRMWDKNRWRWWWWWWWWWWFYLLYLAAIGLTPGGSSTVHIYTQTIHRTTQSTQTIHRTTQFTN